MKSVFVFLLSLSGLFVSAQSFKHPGINQSSEDLALMKKKVLDGEEPWKSAFARLKAAADTIYNVKAHTHVMRGPFGRPNIGGDDLSKSASRAYDLALVWYITGDKSYANKSIEILNAWSPVVWDFDYNDAKLLAAWTGHALCNAAEILRYNKAGWQQQDIERFSEMLSTVYYPLIRFYFPQANGNWDGAIIHSILAMGIFLDNREMFDNGIQHFLHGPVNGSLFKYIYPSGQCQETLRDQGHVQLGLGEFAGAAQVAYTQGVDLFSIGDHRLATGYEFTAGYLLGQKPKSYGVIADRATGLRDDYEYVYRHYSAMERSIPNTKTAADSVRKKASRSVLSSVRVSFEKQGYGKSGSEQVSFKKPGAGKSKSEQVSFERPVAPTSGSGTATFEKLVTGSTSATRTPLQKPVARKTGITKASEKSAARKPMLKPVAVFAGAAGAAPVPAGALIVAPGESIQKALDEAAAGPHYVLVKSGLHTLPGTLKFPSGVTLAGEGAATILYVNPASGERDAIVNATNDLHDIMIRDLVVEGSVKIDRGTDPNSSRSFKNEGNRGGIIFRANTEGQMKNLKFINLTVRNCTYNGVFIAGASGAEFSSCDFDENGSSVIPGPKLQHNLLLSHCADITITGSRFDTSPYGAGVSLLHCSGVTLSGSEIARNAYYGVLVSESKNILVSGCLVEGNNLSGIMMEYLYWGSKNISLVDNTIWFNGGYGVEAYAGKNLITTGNHLEGNGKQNAQENISAEKRIIGEAF